MDVCTQTHREDAMWGQRERSQWCIYKPRKSKDCHQTPEGWRGKKWFFPNRFQRKHDPTDRLNFSLQNCETVKFIKPSIGERERNNRKKEKKKKKPQSTMSTYCIPSSYLIWWLQQVGWILARKMIRYQSQEPVTLSGKTFFAHVIRNIKMRDCLGLCRWLFMLSQVSL